MKLRVENLTIGYDRHIVQSNLNLQTNEGELVCLLGTNGCGKSTLLRTIAGLLQPVCGDIFVDELNVNNISSQERARLLALVLTERNALENTHVEDIVSMGRYPYTNILGGLHQEDLLRVEQAMTQTELIPLRNRYFNSLSDGEKQRVLLAKALAQQTPLILLDEPTAHLDLPGRIKTFSLLQRMAHSQQKTILLSTHDLSLALQTADTLWLMKPMQGVISGTPQSLLQTSVFTDLFGEDILPLLQQKYK